MKIIFSEKCLEYGNGHIESRERVKKAKNFLQESGYQLEEPDFAKEEDLIKVHSKKYLIKLEGGEGGDQDTPAYKNIYEYAKLAAGGAILAAKKQSFSLMRPPGHHAGISGPALGASTKGFCYLNNIAIAVRNLNKKTLILDIDGHHGNGTEEIFEKDEKIIFISLHGRFFYPGTGTTSSKKSINVPLPPDCGEKIYLNSLINALKKINLKEIEVVAVSAGFDSHNGDLASLGLNEKSFEKIGRIIKGLKKYTFFVLEGGYRHIGQNIGQDIDSLLKGFNSNKK